MNSRFNQRLSAAKGRLPKMLLKGFIRFIGGVAFLMMPLLFASSSHAGFRDGLEAKRFCSQLVETGEGPVVGVLDEAVNDSYACSYKGIPYAARPVQKLRWRSPQPAPAHSKVLVADEFGADCVQCQVLSNMIMPTQADQTSEDCLFLNIWRPAKAGVFPVMVWIHGGAFQFSSGSVATYDGASLAARQGVVVISINYRLGMFGFLSHPDLMDLNDGFDGGSAGNYGLLDQVAALAWIQENIARFGGDPDNVTIFGESAGGISTALHMTMPVSWDLYQKVITQSGMVKLALDTPTAMAIGKKFAARVGCDQKNSAECLRAKPAQVLMAVDMTDLVEGNLNLLLMQLGLEGDLTYDFLPRADGVLLPRDPTDAFRDGTCRQVPWMAGFTANDLPELKGPTIAALNAFSQTAARKAYAYRFDYDSHLLGRLAGGFHGSEIPFVFDTLEKFYFLYGFVNLYTLRHQIKAQPLVDTMQSYWANFAKTGDPNGKDLYGSELPEWPAYEAGAVDAMMHLDWPVWTGPAEP